MLNCFSSLQVNDTNATANNSGEQLSKRCIALLKMALKPDVWPNCELKLAWFDRLFLATESTQSAQPGAVQSQPSYANICTALELLTFLIGMLRKDQILAGFKPIQRGLTSLMSCNNVKVIAPFLHVVPRVKCRVLNRSFAVFTVCSAV